MCIKTNFILKMSIKIEGTISSLKKNGSRTIFEVETAKETYKCSIDGFFIAHIGDIISMKAKKEGTAFYEPESPPLIVVPCSEQAIKDCFVKALKSIGPKKADQIYKNIADLITSKNPTCEDIPSEVENVLTHFSMPESDKSVPLWGLSKKEFPRLLLWWWKNNSLRKLYLLGFNRSEITDKAKEYDYHPDKIYKTAIINPFILPFINFDKAVSISRIIGKNITNNMQYYGSVVRKIVEFMNRGSIGVPKDVMLENYPEINNDMLKEYRTIFNENDDMYYLDFVYRMQINVAKNMKAMISMNTEKPINLNDDEKESLDTDKRYKNFDEELSEEQKFAVKECLDLHISIITARGGRGKTRVIKEIVENLKFREEKFLLCSFTGKAVGRIKEICGEDAFTIDKILATGITEKISYLIIDEISMVRTKHIYKLIEILGINVRMVLIGDLNQLPPIGFGNFFEEILKCKKVPTFVLTKCYRTQNGILKNADILLDRKDITCPPEFIEDKSFLIIDENIKFVYTLLNSLKEKGISYNDITALTPMNKYIPEILNYSQKIFFEDADKYESKDERLWCLGERVMHLKNNYNVNLMNGDEGIIEKFDDNGLYVRYKDNYVFYKYREKKMVDEDYEENQDRDNLYTTMIEQSFCKTVHKSQGSEYNYVIFFLPSGASFININLIYTGITRAKKKLFIVGKYDDVMNYTTKPLNERYNNLHRLI